MTTIVRWLDALGERDRDGNAACPAWPPDLFAVCGAILQSSGAYIRVFERREADDVAYLQARALGDEWRSRINRLATISESTLKDALPERLPELWAGIIAARSVQLVDLHDEPNRELCVVLISCVIAADTASVGIGVDTENERFLAAAERSLVLNNQASFTRDIEDRTIAVLGKQHTPQRGATFRSLTHHLSLYWGNDIRGRWIGPFVIDHKKTPTSANLLLLPWPTEVDSDDFHLKAPRKTVAGAGEGRYFEYQPVRKPEKGEFNQRLARALKLAMRHAERIDAVIFPELALSLDEFYEAEQLCAEIGALLISGIRVPAGSSNRGSNLCCMQPAGFLFDLSSDKPQDRAPTFDEWRLTQSKHHRWCLDKTQIIQYQLAGRIPVDVSAQGAAWENIEISRRTMHFMSLGHWMTWCVLICEDLARQDPAADLIRAVGPNLLITLLMDGPQLPGRWPSRYASVLTDDPGTSVLTLTSIGMAERSRPTLESTGKRADKQRIIALWRDVDTGERELVLDPGDDACILYLSCASRTEVAADGRGDGDQAHFPAFAGYKSFKVGHLKPAGEPG